MFDPAKTLSQQISNLSERVATEMRVLLATLTKKADSTHTHVAADIKDLATTLGSYLTLVEAAKKYLPLAGGSISGTLTASGLITGTGGFKGNLTGNASTATKLKAAQTIDGVAFDGSTAITHYGTCSTEAASAAKTVALAGFKLVAGARVLVNFTVTNTATNSSVTLNVNNTGAKPITYRGSASGWGNSTLAAGRTYDFIYNGESWEFVGDLDYRYSAMTGATSSAAGEAGLVPAPAAGKHGAFLRGDGTWQAITSVTGNAETASKLQTARTISFTGGATGNVSFDGSKNVSAALALTGMKAATASAAGAAGAVPAPAAGAQAKYLRGDGTWQNPPNTTYGNFTGATSSAAGKAGLVPAPAAGKQKAYLCADGTWVDPSSSGVPPGTIIHFAGKKVPAGYLICNGAPVSAATYPNLYAAIGNTYGGNSTTFNLPNLSGRFLEGTTSTSEVGTYKSAGLPNITGTGWFYGTETIEYTTGALRGDNTSRTRENGAHGDVVKQYPQLQLDASWSDAQYGAASNVQPNSLRALALIKI